MKLVPFRRAKSPKLELDRHAGSNAAQPRDPDAACRAGSPMLSQATKEDLAYTLRRTALGVKVGALRVRA